MQLSHSLRSSAHACHVSSRACAAVQPAPCLRRCGRRPRRVVAARADAAGPSAPSSSIDRLSYDKILLAILDSNPYLSDGSRQAIATAADLAQIHSSKVTVLVVDHPGSTGDPAVKMQTISKSLAAAGCDTAEVLEKSVPESGSALIGDLADEISADLVLLSSEAVHTKQVDANLLAEFVGCPVLLLP